MAKASAEDYRQWTRSYVSKRQERGEKQATVWVPESRLADLKAFATQLRIEEGLEEARPPQAPRVQVPQLEVPELPPPSWSYLRIEKRELGLRMLLKANGGEWIRGNTKVDATWKLRSDLVAKLGLEDRVVHERKTWSETRENRSRRARCA